VPELRRDPVRRRWVIVAPERAGDLLPRRAPAPPEAAAEPCPFCPGQEHLNPTEIAAVQDGRGWTIRVTPDRSPLLHIEGTLNRRGAGMFDVMDAIGAHEVVSDTPSHRAEWADFDPAHMARLLGVYRSRSHDLGGDPRFRHVLVLKNHAAVWSRFPHAHSHVVATPFTPKRIEEELDGAREYFRMRERCVFCDQVAEELVAEQRIVATNAEAVAFAPFAAESPYELWVVPRRHAADFGAVTEPALAALADLLIDVLGRVRVALDDPPYSVVLHGGPLDGRDRAEFHWHWEIVPHLGKELGMEWATGIFSNPVPPEEAARLLRGARAARRS
jgi:UDPglucose--hexose-1-phosphate uridylyltransferase